MIATTRRYSAAELWTICLLAVAPVARLALLTGPMGSDDLNYFHFAQQLARLEHITQLHHHAGRLAFLLVVGVPAALLGSITSGAILNVVMLSARDLFVVWFVRRETDATCTAFAATVVAANAVSLSYAGIMIPDPLLGVLMFASAVSIHAGLTGAAPGRARLLAGGGAFAALAYSAKDSGVLMLAPSLAYVLVARGLALRERVRLAVLYGLGFVAVAVLEMLAYGLISGDVLYRSHALSKVHNASIVESPDLVAFAHAIYWNLRLAVGFYAASTTLLVGGAAVLVAALVLRTRLAFFSATGLFVGLYLIFGTSSFGHLMPLPVQDRYFEPLVAFVAVGTAALTQRLSAGSGRRAMRAVGAVLAIGFVVSWPSIASNAGDVTFAGVGRNAGVALRALHAARPDVPIVVSPMLHRMIEPFVPPELFAALRPMAGERIERAFYLVHPWEADDPAVPLLAATRRLPVYLVVDEDQRWLGRWALDPRATDRGAVVHASIECEVTQSTCPRP